MFNWTRVNEDIMSKTSQRSHSIFSWKYFASVRKQHRESLSCLISSNKQNCLLSCVNSLLFKWKVSFPTLCPVNSCVQKCIQNCLHRIFGFLGWPRNITNIILCIFCWQQNITSNPFVFVCHHLSVVGFKTIVFFDNIIVFVQNDRQIIWFKMSK